MPRSEKMLLKKKSSDQLSLRQNESRELCSEEALNFCVLSFVCTYYPLGISFCTPVINYCGWFTETASLHLKNNVK